jgi:hypothetical protein
VIRLLPLVFLLLGLVVLGCDTGTRPTPRTTNFGPGSGAVGTPPAQPPDDHGNDVSNPTVIQVGRGASGVIDYVGDKDWFAIDLVGGSRYDFLTVTQGDTVLHLVDANGSTVLADNDDEDQTTGKLNSLIASFMAPADGTYYLVVGQGSNNVGLPSYITGGIKK